MTKMIYIIAMILGLSQISAAREMKKELIPTKLHLNWKAEPEFGGFYTALINKYYEKNGLQAEVIQGGAGTPTVQMVATGQADFGIVSGDEILISRSNGAKVVGLFAVFQKAPYAFMLHADSKISSIKELYSSGSTVSVVKGLPFLTYLDKKFAAGRNIQQVPYAGGISNFINDKKFVQQCFISSEPLLAEKQGLKVKTLLVADEGFNPYTVVLATNEDTLKKRPELVKAMVKAVREGWTEYLKNAGPTHEAITKLNPSMTMDAMTGIHIIETPFIESAETKKYGLGVMTLKRWEELSSQMKDLGLTKTAIPAKEAFQSAK